MSDSDDAPLPAIDADEEPDDESAEALSFLVDLDPEALGANVVPAKPRPKRDTADFDEEEQATRRFREESDGFSQGQLPVKTVDGRVVPNDANDEMPQAPLEPKKLSKKQLRKAQKRDEREKAKREKGPSAAEQDEALLRALQSRSDDKDLLSDEWVRARKLELGLLCDAILQSPDAAFLGRQGEVNKVRGKWKRRTASPAWT
eukprot:scaffold735_cov255-Pinguiococcus_pyrenoidosus.AAC.31